MTTLLTNARLIDPEGLTETPGALVVADGKIAEVLTQPVENTDTFPAGKVIDCGGKCLAPGIVDLGVKVGEPGERHKESFRSAGLAAAAGGVTTIIARPDTATCID
ncbi:MAG: dihydroorotase, partial [Rhodobacteraceae bacterium]|nr:dihydroorotase [Paracoccaceae bacterium]